MSAPIAVSPYETANSVNEFKGLALKKLGLMDYEASLALQREFHSDIADLRRPSTLMLLEHPPVFTAGRRTLPEEMPHDGSRVIEVDRGGKITFHGPGQIVGYPKDIASCLCHCILTIVDGVDRCRAFSWRVNSFPSVLTKFNCA